MGAPELPRTTFDAGTFGRGRGTRLSVVSFQHDTLILPLENKALYAHLTGEAPEHGWAAIEGADAVHGMPCPSPPRCSPPSRGGSRSRDRRWGRLHGSGLINDGGDPHTPAQPRGGPRRPAVWCSTTSTRPRCSPVGRAPRRPRPRTRRSGRRARREPSRPVRARPDQRTGGSRPAPSDAGRRTSGPSAGASRRRKRAGGGAADLVPPYRRLSLIHI